MNNSIPKTSGIYKITCTANGKIYVGSSNDISIRWNTHKKSLRKGKHHSTYMQRCWNKYGEQSFTFEIIELVMPWSILDREQYWLDKLKPFGQRGFNTKHQANGGRNVGFKHSPETRKKISIANKGRIATPEERIKLSIAKKGKKHKPHSEETKARMSEFAKKRSTPEYRARISAKLMGHPGAMKGRKLTVEQVEKVKKRHNKKWIVIKQTGEELEIVGLRQFCKDNKLSQPHMWAVANGKRPHHQGWKCRYAESKS